MPGLYPRGEYDLVGTIIGTVSPQQLITGKKIRRGDVLIGLPSSGLHTNGYSLARKIIFAKARLQVDDVYPGTEKSVADVLLAVHRSYLKPVKALMNKVNVLGIAHITGGGIVDNVPRMLPPKACAVIDRSRWSVPPSFQFIAEEGRVNREEMYPGIQYGDWTHHRRARGRIRTCRKDVESRAGRSQVDRSHRARD